MQKLPKEVTPLPPNMCFICETTPRRDAGEDIVDTTRTFEPTPPNARSGRIYVCSNCVDGLARAMGYVKSGEVEKARKAVMDAQETLARLKDRIRGLLGELTGSVTENNTINALEIPISAVEEEEFQYTEEQPKKKRRKAYGLE